MDFLSLLLLGIPAVLAFLRWDILNKDGPLFILLTWIWLSDTLRWTLLPHTGASLVVWMALDALQVSWYQAHVLAIHRGRWTLLVACLTTIVTLASAGYYVGVERWMGVFSLRFVWLELAGLGWSGVGILWWLRQDPGPGQVLGATSSGLSVAQVLHLRPQTFWALCPRLFHAITFITLVGGFVPYLKTQTNSQKR